MKREKVYRETIDALLKKKKMTRTDFCEQIGYTPSWFSKSFAKGYYEVPKPNLLLWALVIGCAEADITAIPVSPKGKAKNNADCQDSVEPNKETADIKETMVDGFRMLHQDLQMLIETMHKYWRSEEPKYQVRDREQP